MENPKSSSISPALSWYSNHLLDSGLWARHELGVRDRCIATVAAVAAGRHADQLPIELHRALDHGLAPLELVELITHLAFYAGWPCALSAANHASDCLQARGIDADGFGQSIGVTWLSPPESDHPPNAPFSFALDSGIGRVVSSELWKRSGLSVRDRAIITIAVDRKSVV